MISRLVRLTGLAAAALLVHAAGCSSSDSPAPATGAPSGPAGGPVAGAADSHCTVDGGVVKQVTSAAACSPDAGADDAAGGSDAGGDGAPAADDYGDALHGTEGDDDDCKYHLSWSSSPIYESYDVTFSIAVTRTADSAAATAAKPYAEVYLDDTHPAPSTNATSTESAGGRYTIGPIRFDKAGDWTVRFHLYGDCVDGEESPHGHVAFLVHVP